MAGVASKNLFDLLGNTSDDDPDRIPVPITTPVDKPLPRKGKRDAAADAAPANVPTTAPAPRGGRGGGRGGRYSGNERAFRDRDAGRDSNRTRPTDESGRGPRGPRGGRGGARPRPFDDRHSKGVGAGPNDHAKQAAHGWGDDTGAGELRDEQAGEQIATEEIKQGFDANVDKPVNADGENPVTDAPEAEPEPEDKTKSYAEYLAELAEKKLQLGGGLSARQANEGSGKKLPEGKELARDGDAEYFAGSGGKARRERERKEKNVFVLDHDIQARERETSSRGGRGGRGRGRGDSFRGERGDRGRGGRGRGEGRGEGRGDFRGSRGGRGGATINVGDTSAFPSLGA